MSILAAIQIGINADGDVIVQFPPAADEGGEFYIIVLPPESAHRLGYHLIQRAEEAQGIKEHPAILDDPMGSA